MAVLLQWPANQVAESKYRISSPINYSPTEIVDMADGDAANTRLLKEISVVKCLTKMYLVNYSKNLKWVDLNSLTIGPIRMILYNVSTRMAT